MANQIKTNQIKTNQIKTNQPKPNQPKPSNQDQPTKTNQPKPTNQTNYWWQTEAGRHGAWGGDPSKRCSTSFRLFPRRVWPPPGATLRRLERTAAVKDSLVNRDPCSVLKIRGVPLGQTDAGAAQPGATEILTSSSSPWCGGSGTTPFPSR